MIGLKHPQTRIILCNYLAVDLERDGQVLHYYLTYHNVATDEYSRTPDCFRGCSGRCLGLRVFSIVFTVKTNHLGPIKLFN